MGRFSKTALTAMLASPALAVNYTELCNNVYNFVGNQEAKAVVTYVNYVPANVSDTIPGYCNATGLINTYTGFQIRFPANASEYVGTFTSQGCGSNCGVFQQDGLHPIFATDEKPLGEGTANAVLRRGYIASMTNMGYFDSDYFNTYYPVTNVSANSGSWTPFRNNRTNEISFAYEATHLMAVLGKELAKWYYGEYPKYSYFVGGSTGGRQGLVEAQRYPRDFNGISAGQPPLNETYVGSTFFKWLLEANFDADGQPILSADDGNTLSDMALLSCDHLDGLVDGLIDNADQCVLNWELIRCGSSTVAFNETTCFNEEKISAAKKIYDTPRFKDGTPILAHARFLPGSEQGWYHGGFIGLNNSLETNLLYGFATAFTKYACYEVDKPDNWTLAEFDYEVDPYQMGFMESYYTAQRVDLTEFKEAGGKMLLMHSWSDEQVPIPMTLDYYNRVRKAMGGQESTDEFLRMFLMPGMWHVWGNGPGATSGQDVYKTLVNWVEKGVAPDAILGTKYNPNGTVSFRRNSYRFPYYAKYDGVGDWRNECSWGPELRLAGGGLDQNSGLTEFPLISSS